MTVQDFVRPQQDLHRPLYHFTASSGWLNDPNGITWHDGRWHLFYQHNPAEARWGQIHWGHASSADLLHWRDEPIALAPTPGSADEHGCFSGSFALVGGLPTMYYTGWASGVQSQCRATSRDLVSWEKDPANPIIPTPPARVRNDDFRDPYVFRHGEWWYMVLGASLDHDRGAVLLYRSEDGQHWEDRGVLFEASRSELGVMWECPNFFPLDGSWVLLVSIWPGLGAHYFVGDFENERFTARREGVLDADGGAFAHLTAISPDGRRLQWGWINEQREQSHTDRGGWAGALSVPRELKLEGEDLRVQPAAELAQLRGKQLYGADVTLSPEPLKLEGIHLDLSLQLQPDIEHPVELALRQSPDAAEETRLTFDPSARQLRLDRTRASADPRTRRDTQRAHLHLRRGEGLDLRVLLDGSVLEVYANGRVCMSSRLYPERPDSVGLTLTAQQPTQASLSVWEIRAGDYFGRRR